MPYVCLRVPVLFQKECFYSSTTACEKTRTVEEVEQKVYEVETAYSTVPDYTAPYPTAKAQPGGVLKGLKHPP